MPDAAGEKRSESDGVGGDLSRGDEGRIASMPTGPAGEPKGIRTNGHEGQWRPADGGNRQAGKPEVKPRGSARQEEASKQKLAAQLGNAGDQVGEVRETAALRHVARWATREDGVGHSGRRRKRDARTRPPRAPAEGRILAKGLIDRRHLVKAPRPLEGLAGNEQIGGLEKLGQPADLERAIEWMHARSAISDDGALDQICVLEGGKSVTQPSGLRSAVGVREREHRRGRGGYPSISRATGAGASTAEHRHRPRCRTRDGGGAIGRAVVDDDYLEGLIEVLLDKGREGRSNRCLRIVRRHDHADDDL